MRRIQFSLRFFLISCLILGVALVFVIRSFQSHQQLQDSISGIHRSAGSGHDFNFSLQAYINHRDEPVAFMLWIVEDEVPKIRYSYRYTSGQGGTLVVDDATFRPSELPWLFVSGPYGHTMKLELSEAESNRLFDCLSGKTRRLAYEFWHDVVENKIYVTDGNLVDGLRDGPWSFRLTNGNKYMEGGYRKGKRHGEWTTYYPDGTVRAKLNYEDGQAAGIWTYFHEDGKPLASGTASKFRYRISNKGGVLVIDDMEISTPDLPVDVDTVFPQKRP